ncbi:MAG: chlorite dismutase family protein [Chloroflexi bacterium]|nr:chlorite dismutase family protein [Chloroflexota bacterium]
MPPNQRQFVKYAFYRVDPAWRRLPQAERREGGRELQTAVERWQDRILIRSYTTLGIRGDADFMLWQVTSHLEDFPAMAADLLSTGLGRYLETPYCYLAMTRRSVYIAGHRHAGQEGRRLAVQPSEMPYLFVYPFVKTRAWYTLPMAERQRMMDQHIEIGHRYPSVKINTAYSFGLDDQEFVVAFETDSPSDFLDLVMELRESEASSYTLRDTPSFTCVAQDVPEILASLGR